jgi:hypothetical protein
LANITQIYRLLATWMVLDATQTTVYPPSMITH